MWPYWLMFAVPAFAAIGIQKALPGQQQIWRASKAAMISAAFIYALLIGFRYEVGGDWFTYLELYEDMRGADLIEALSQRDPGYQSLTWLSLQLGWDVFGVNIMCGGIFAAGLFTFCYGLPRPWLAVAVAVPYLVIVVAMGYSRQGVALGCAMLALAQLRRGAMLWCIALLIVGASFHRTAVVLIPVVGLIHTRNRYWTALWAGSASVLAYQVFLAESVEGLYTSYVEAEYQSEGALIRLAMTAVAGSLFLVFRKRFWFPPTESRQWLLLSIISVALLVIFFFTEASTALDRIGLYMLPLQLAICSQLPNVLGPRAGRNQQMEFAILFFYGVVLFVWLNFATHSQAWIPYRFYLLDGSL